MKLSTKLNKRREKEMKDLQYTVKNSLGIHARPAALLAQACTNFKSAVMIECNGNVASGNNVLQILALHAAKGSVLNITADGPDEEEAITKIQEVLKEIAPKAKKNTVLRVAFFGTKDYDRIFFSELSRDKGEGTYNVDIKYFNSRLTIESANLAKGYDAVCIFVNDEAPRQDSTTLTPRLPQSAESLFFVSPPIPPMQ